MCEYFCFSLDVDICQSGLSNLVFGGPSVLAVCFVSRCQGCVFQLAAMVYIFTLETQKELCGGCLKSHRSPSFFR